MEATIELLRRLAANDEACLQAVLSRRRPPLAGAGGDVSAGLAVRPRVLVELAALLVTDASTTSLQCAADRAGAAGAPDEALVAVLLLTAAAVGAAQTVTNASRLALALNIDIEA